MAVRKSFLKIAGLLVSCTLPILLLITTNTGLNTILTAVTMFSPIPFSYGSATGKIIGQPIEISDIYLEQDGHPINIGKLNVDWQLHQLRATDITGAEKLLPISNVIPYQEIHIETIHASLDSLNKNRLLQIQIRGHSQKVPITAQMRLTQDDNWHINYAILNYGKNSSLIKQDGDNYSWNIAFNAPEQIFKNSQGSLKAHGSLQDMASVPFVQAYINTQKFKIDTLALQNLQANLSLHIKPNAPLKASIVAQSLTFGTQELYNINLKLNGDLDAHKFVGHVSYEQNPVLFTANGSYKDYIWQAKDIILGFRAERLEGNAEYNFLTEQGYFDLSGSILSAQTKAMLKLQPSTAELKMSMYANTHNFLNAQLALKGQKLDGKITVQAHDIAPLMQFMPDITRLKGKFNADVSILGTVNKPEITTDAKLTEITATLPNLGVKIKPMAVYVTSDKNGKFYIKGHGAMRRGPGEFTLQGFVEPFKEGMPNSLSIEGKRVEFVNNNLAHLLASCKLDLHFAQSQQRLDINGNIEILQGSITIHKTKHTVKSKDVVFVNESMASTKRLLKINPDINLRISEGVHFTGFDLDADVTGKLNISHRHAAMYGDGRITIKEGTYQIPGQKLQIYHGRLLFPPGTLLVNPVLDIKMLGVERGNVTPQEAKHNLELNVQGTAQKPIITETGLSTDKDRALSQAILSGSSVISNNILQDKLKISEIGVRSHDEEHVEFFDDPSKNSNLRNKDLVIGRSLGKRFYLQYLHSIGEANIRVRLKYALSKVWAIGVESGTEGGGVDLSFAIERD